MAANQEARDGDNTQGYYFVQLPDGRLQKVTYSVQGDSGFLAEVTYEGEAQYPQQRYGPSARHPIRPTAPLARTTPVEQTSLPPDARIRTPSPPLIPHFFLYLLTPSVHNLQ
ncbi:uncharacterized protein LOC123502046 [Portunus trituberculatus]|uniref:uncharacterized protein LOC123502046 n=1 Tax=Portunus trituberculatus TaxID=210409 RepID=UPI001E1CBBA5|nr:uncharacterized protein LOC123502046 [Portunus trituberculatus]